ncbi:MAG TPA: murein biosynthesis integral membrane protein MurJ [Roseiflexaceae bacterium]|nr:murein biosynthesis integral membrane protein MurJ [Roseiflexaceae bacterium]
MASYLRTFVVNRRMLSALLLRECSIPEGSLIFTAAFLISAALGVVRQVLFNAQFGAGMEASAYYAAFRLPETLANLIAGGALSNALIPVLASAHRAGGAVAEERLASLALTTLSAAVALAALAAALLAPWFVGALLAPGFDAPTAALTVALTRLMLLQSVLAVASSVAIAVLNRRSQFVLSGLSIVAHNLTLIGGILAARAYPPLGIYGPALGIVGDAALQLAILWPGLRAAGLRLRPVWDLLDRRLREVLRLLVPNGLSATVNYAGTIVDTAFASLAREEGAIPALYNAALLVGLPVRLIGVALAQAAFPRLAAHAAAGEWRTMRHTLLRGLAATAGLSGAAFLGLWLLGRPLIRALFERGRFDADAGALTYALLVLFAAGLPAYVMTEVLTRGLIALHDTLTPLLTNCGQLAVRALAIWLLLGPLGAAAIPLAVALSAALETAALAFVLSLRLRRPGVRTED